MNTQQTQALLRAGLVLLIVVLINVVSVRIFARLDLTKQGVYTLSDASRQLVGRLDDRLTVKAYFTEDLPSPYNNNRRALLDILNEYRAYSHGNLHFEFVNPEGEKAEQNAQQQGVPPVEVQVVKEDKLEVKRAYLGVVLLYEDRKEVLPVIQNLSSLEYDLSSAITRVTARTKKRIGYTTGHGEPTPQQLQNVTQELNGRYTLVPVDLNGPVAQDLATLLVLSPQSIFSDSACRRIDEYIMHGGKAAFLINRMNATLQQRFAQPLNLGLDSLLMSYGARVNADLVRDAQCANVTVAQQQGAFQMRSQIPYPYLVSATTFDRANAMVKDLQGLLFHFVSSVDTTPAAGQGVRAEVLVRTSKQSGRQAGFMMIDPFARYQSADFAESGIPLAVVLSGSFKSPYTGARSPESRILVVGDGDLMKDEFLGSRNNITFFVNAVDYLADDAGLITIRSKDVVQPPLEPLSDSMKRTVKYANLALPPLLIVGYGLVRWRRRVARKRLLEAQEIKS
jgi:gliding-associated putative ABC transporter substrate-binding component GldG